MQISKSFKFGSVEIKVNADWCNDELEIVSVVPIIDEGRGGFYENIGDAMLEEIPGFAKLLEKLDWTEEIRAEERERNGALHSEMFSSWQPKEVTLYEPARVVTM